MSRRFFVAAISVSFLCPLIVGTTLTANRAYSETPGSRSTLSNTDLDIMFGKSRPTTLGPHPLVYMTESEAKQVKGKNPMAIAVIRGGIGAAVGAGASYMNGGDGRAMAVGAVAGFAGGFWGSFGSAAAGGGYAGAFAGGISGGYGSLGTIGGCNSCHQVKR
ncbi:hypothetical protein QE372_001891 [Agrobacterium pusense]|nr:hypothetical protein [Agrobacterium pusense]